MTRNEWLTCDDPERMQEWLVGTNGICVVSDRKLRLLAVACCRSPGVWPLIGDGPGGRFIAAAARFADRLMSPRDFHDMHRHAGELSSGCGGMDTGALAHRIDSMLSKLRHRAVPMAPLADLAREVIGDPWWPPVTMAAGLLSGPALSLAQAAYEELSPGGTLDPVRLSILADALEEAGCTEERLLRHLRSEELCIGCSLDDADDRYYGGGGGWCAMCDQSTPELCWMPLRAPHVQGCWAVDLVLGKS